MQRVDFGESHLQIDFVMTNSEKNHEEQVPYNPKTKTNSNTISLCIRLPRILASPKMK